MTLNPVPHRSSTASLDAPPPSDSLLSSAAGPVQRLLSPELAAMSGVGERWLGRLLLTGAGVMLLMELAYFAIDLRLIAPPWTRMAALHLLLIADVAAIMPLMSWRRLAAYRRAILLVMCVPLFAITAALARVTGEMDPLILTVTVTVLGAAALMPWSTAWQLALSLAGLAAIAAAHGVPETAPIHWYHLLTALTAIGVGFCATMLGERYRAERDARIAALARGHHALLAETAQRERAIGEREQALERLRENEAKLRQIFEASLDMIATSRLSDGRFIDCNRGFLEITGYTREEAIGRSAQELGVWANRSDLREYMRRLRTEGHVRQMETTLRNKDGLLIPHLVTGVVARIGGEPCIVTIGHDITELKRTEHELLAAREELSRQVAALRDSEWRQREEIREREQAQARLQESETTLRKVFEANYDAIALTDFGSGRLLRVNQSFLEVTGLGLEQVIGQTPREMNIWAERPIASSRV